MTYVQYCLKCERQTDHEWRVMDAPSKYRMHGRITDTVGWLECRECGKRQKDRTKAMSRCPTCGAECGGG